MRRFSVCPALFVAVAMLLGATGCDELTARRTLQEASRAYEAGHFEDATAKCDAALEILPEFDIAIHNCAIIYYKWFRPGDDTPENIRAADRATELFGRYLKKHPEEGRFVDFMSQVWIDSNQHEKALAYWEAEHAKKPKNIDVIQRVATIHRMSGEWQRSIEWHEIEMNAEETAQGKTRALKNIANLVASKLLYNRASIKWQERQLIADIGIHAMQRAEKLTPDDFEVQQLLGNLFGSRGEAQQPAWAQLLDTAHSRFHYKKFSKLKLGQQGHTPAPEGKEPEGDEHEGAGDSEAEGVDEGDEAEGADEGDEGESSGGGGPAEGQATPPKRDENAAKP